MIHINRDQNLPIKRSTLPSAGLGFFKPFNRNQIIVPYTGTHSSTETDGNYVLEVNKNHYINGNRYIDTAVFANDAEQVNKRINQSSGNNTGFTINQS